MSLKINYNTKRKQ